ADELGEADTASADWKQGPIDRPFAGLRWAPVLGDPAHLDRGIAGLVHGHGVGSALRARGCTAAADQVGELIELGPHLAAVVLEVLARFLLDEQVRRFGAAAGEARERDGAVAVLQGELKADPDRIAVLRAVAVSAEPLRRGLVEGGLELGRGQPIVLLGELVLHQPARQNLWIIVVVAGGEPKTARPESGRRWCLFRA